jgi:flagellar hook-associated protein 3 FlgL
MISGLDPANEQFLASMNDLQTRVNDAQNQLTTGLRVTKASDAPQSVGDIFQARSDLGQQSQFIQNLTNVQSQVTTADSTIQSSIELLQQAIVLGTQGATSTTSAAQQQQLATQVQNLEAQIVTLSRTQVSGVYIFSGDQVGSPSYQVNTASPTGVDRLIVTQATQKIQDPTGVGFQVSITAQDLFDKRDNADNPTAQNVFAALNSLTLALQAGNTSAVSTALGSVQTSYTYLNQQLGFYGAVENRINNSLDLAKKFQLQDQTQLSSLQDADIPTASVAFTQATTGMNAAMAAEAKRPHTSLFDYLP